MSSYLNTITTTTTSQLDENNNNVSFGDPASSTSSSPSPATTDYGGLAMSEGSGNDGQCSVEYLDNGVAPANPTGMGGGLYFGPTSPLIFPEFVDHNACHLLECNGFMIEASAAQRKYVGESAKWDGKSSIPGLDCELYVGNLPKDVFEHDLIPLFEQHGPVWDLRLMMNATSFKSRGYAFVKYTNTENAKKAVAALNNYPLRGSGGGSGSGGKGIQVEFCKPKVRLFIGNIPKAKPKHDLFAEFARRTRGLKDVIIYKSPEDKKQNRGFCFLEYDSHGSAFVARRILSDPLVKLWGCEIIVDWADPLECPDESVMCQVRVLYVRNLTSKVTEDKLQDLFTSYGVVERVKRIKDFAFVHFDTRENAERALSELHDQEFCGTQLEITWAKPPIDKQRKEEILRARERRMTELQQSTQQYDSHLMNNPSTINSARMSDLNDLIYGDDVMYGGSYDYPPHCIHIPEVINDTTYYSPPRSSHPAYSSLHTQDSIPFQYESYLPPRPSSGHYGLAARPATAPPAPSQYYPRPFGDCHFEDTIPHHLDPRFIPRAASRRAIVRPRDRIPAEIIDGDNNWRSNSGPSMIDQLQNSPHTVVGGGGGAWRRTIN